MFLYGMYKNGCLYSGIFVVQSALSSVVMIKGYEKLPSYTLITIFVKGYLTGILLSPNMPTYGTLILFKAFVYQKYKGNAKLCIVNWTQFYLGKQNFKVDDNKKKLIITYWKPHKNGSADNIPRCVIKKLKNTKIDLNIYKAHSCRAASSSKAKQIEMSVPEILKRGC